MRSNSIVPIVTQNSHDSSNQHSNNARRPSAEPLISLGRRPSLVQQQSSRGMNSIEEYLQHHQAQSHWGIRRTARSIVFRLRKTVKRRLRGESHRQWIERNLNDSEAGAMLDVLQCIFSLCMVYSIMHQNWHMSAYSRDASAHNIDILNLVAISLNFCVRMYAAGNRWAYCRHWISIVDFCCWIPLFVDAAAPFDETKQSKYVFRLFLMARTIRIVQLYRLLRLVKHAKVRQGISIGLTVVSIIICAAAMIQTVEYCDPTITTQVFGENCQNLSFSDSIYFICITIGTVGYGEYAPKSKIGKVSTICLIIFTGLLIPTQISALTEILSRETIFDKKYRPDKRIQHVLLCGDIDNGSLNFFLHNWLHSDGERGSRRKVIILSPTFPSSSLRRILIHREYEQRVQYLQGSAMDTNDLQRAGATSAACCFVMVRKHSDTEERSDTSTNLLTCSIRKNNRQAPLYVQVSKVDNVRHVNISGASAVVCVEQLKLSMFGKSLWIRGLNAFLGNLVQRFDITNESSSFWLHDYINGLCHRIYEAVIPSCLMGMSTFRSLAILLYREVGVPVIGIRTLQEAVMIYPVDKDLNDVGFHSVFFLGRGRDTVSKIEKLTAAVFSCHMDVSPNLEISSSRSHISVSKVINSVAGVAKDNFGALQRLSVALGADHRGSLRGLTPQALARHDKRGLDRITPLHTEDDVGDSESFDTARAPGWSANRKGSSVAVTNEPRHPASIRDENDSNRRSARVDSSDEDPDDPPFAPPTAPVIALSPAELMKKATAPVIVPALTTKMAVTPRSPRKTPRVEPTPPPPMPNDDEEVPMDRAPRTNGPQETSVDIPDTDESYRGVTEEPSQRRSSVTFSVEPTNGPSVLEVEGIHPPEIEPSPVNETNTAAETDRVASLKLNRSPTLRRMSQRPSQPHVARTSHYRSFRRKSPPSSLTDHYVICGAPSSYRDLLGSLSDLSEKRAPIVFVTPRDLSEKDFVTYIQNTDVYFVRGSPVSMEVFEEARMLHARSILILSYCGREGNDDDELEGEQLDENMADVDAITTHRFISEACQNRVSSLQSQSQSNPRQRQSIQLRPTIPNIVVEMMRPSNVKFLVDRSGSMYDEHCPENEDRVRDLLKDIRGIDDSFFSPLYAGGHVYFSNFMDALLASPSQNPFVIDMMTQLIISGNATANHFDRDARSKHRLSQIPVPARFHNRPYALLVEGLLLHESTMTLGVFRSTRACDSPSFVFTNPAANELVHANDFVFVIK